MGRCLLPEQEAGSSLHRIDTGSPSRKNIRKRSTSKSKRRNLESGQRESEMQNSCTIDQIRRMYRDVIIGSIRDLGCGNALDREPVLSWLGGPKFPYICQCAGWEYDWVSELFTSIISLSKSVRKPVTRDCVEMLKAVARLQDLRKFDSLPADNYLDAHIYKPVIMPSGDPPQPAPLRSSLSRASQKRWENMTTVY